MAEQSELALADLADAPWIVRDHQQRYTDAHETMCRIAGFEPRIVFHTQDYQALQGLVAAEIGVSLVPQMCIVTERPEIVTRPLASPSFARRVAALTLPGADRDQVVSNMLGVLREVCGQYPFTSGTGTPVAAAQPS